MYNGSHTDGSLTSVGSWYNARVVNALWATTAVSAGTIYSDNICPKTWTVFTNSQANTIANNYASEWNKPHHGYYDRNQHIGKINGTTDTHYWTRVASSSTKFYNMYHSTTTLLRANGYDLDIRYGCFVRCVAK